MLLRSGVNLSLAARGLVKCQPPSIGDEMCKVGQDVVSNAQDEMAATTAPVPLPEEIQTGHFAFWGLLTPPADNMKIVVDSTSNPDKTSIWGRFQYEHMDIAFLIDDISTGFRTGPMTRLRFKFVWRARSTDYGSVVIDNPDLGGDIGFYSNGDELVPSRDIEISLGGANMAREGYVEAGKIKGKHFANREESRVLKEIKEMWEALGRDPNLVNMKSMRAHWGSIMGPRHDATCGTIGRRAGDVVSP